MADDSERPLVFISYSHKDEIWKDRLRPHLDMFSFDSELVIWDDRQIEPTTAWFEEIQAIMERAKVAICLISPDYLSSSFCRNHEIPYLLQRHARGEMVLIFILVRPCAWEKLPWLAALQILPRDNKAISKHFVDDWDTPFSEIASYVVDRISDELTPDKFSIFLNKELVVKGPDQKIDLTRLPTSGFDVVGRDEELQFLNEAFDGDTLNVVSLRAWGGVGKSTLVNKWCEYLAADNYRGARRTFAWSFYSQGTKERVTSADAFIDEALRFFEDNDPTAGSPWSKGERLAELVGKEKALLILDGMEPLQDEHQGIKDPALARLVECLAEQNAGLCVITTREPVKEFSDFSGTTQEIDLEHLSKEAGRALLRIKGLRAADDLLEQASEAFGNHAFALNLLASYLKRFAGGVVHQALAIPDLPDVSVEDGKHPRRVMAAFAEAFGEGPELDLLHVMGLFDRPADAGCIAGIRLPPAIPGLTERLSTLDEIGIRELLEKLRSFGLLATAGYHALEDLDAHPLVREFFGARLRVEREEAWKAGHSRLYEHLKNVPDKHQPDTLSEMTPLIQAIQHGCQAGLHLEAYRSICCERLERWDEHYLTYKLGFFGISLGLLSNFFDVPFTNPNENLDEEHQARFLHGAAFHLASLGRNVEAHRAQTVSLDFYITKELWHEASVAANNVAILHLDAGKIGLAADFADSSLKYSEMSGDDDHCRMRLSNLGEVLHFAGKFRDAKTAFDRGHARQTKGKNIFIRLLTRHADFLLTLGQAQKAKELADKGLLVGQRQELTRLIDFGLCESILGCVERLAGRYDGAHNRLNRAVEIFRRAGETRELPRGLLDRAKVFCETEAYEKSRKDLAEAMRIAKRCGMRLHECDAHLEYARLALAEGNPDAALSHFQSADALVTECGYHRRDPELLDLKEKLGL